MASLSPISHLRSLSIIAGIEAIQQVLATGYGERMHLRCTYEVEWETDCSLGSWRFKLAYQPVMLQITGQGSRGILHQRHPAES